MGFHFHGMKLMFELQQIWTSPLVNFMTLYIIDRDVLYYLENTFGVTDL